MTGYQSILYFIGAWNGIVFLFFGLDKLLAVLKFWRFCDALLILLTFLLGGVGALTGMLVFFHKVRKWKFLILIPIAAMLTMLVTGYCIYHVL